MLLRNDTDTQGRNEMKKADSIITEQGIMCHGWGDGVRWILLIVTIIILLKDMAWRRIKSEIIQNLQQVLMNIVIIIRLIIMILMESSLQLKKSKPLKSGVKMTKEI